jgi:hypothetical protein
VFWTKVTCVTLSAVILGLCLFKILTVNTLFGIIRAGDFTDVRVISTSVASSPVPGLPVIVQVTATCCQAAENVFQVRGFLASSDEGNKLWKSLLESRIFQDFARVVVTESDTIVSQRTMPEPSMSHIGREWR